jgi:hypothetical protein
MVNFQISFSAKTPATTSIYRRLSNPACSFSASSKDDDGGVCYIETHDTDTCAGHFRLRLLEFKPTRLAFEIARTDHKYVEVAYELDPFRIELPLQVNIGGRRFTVISGSVSTMPTPNP